MANPDVLSVEECEKISFGVENKPGYPNITEARRLLNTIQAMREVIQELIFTNDHRGSHPTTCDACAAVRRAQEVVGVPAQKESAAAE